jgi:putative tryptophan/tyrosine transport system substrate-binding protein
MRRRELISLVGSTVVAWPLAARAQQAATPLIGFLSSRSPNESEVLVAAFVRVWRKPGMLKVKMSTSHFVGQRVAMIDCRN